MARRDLASLELFIRTLQSSDAAAIQRQSQVLGHKKLGLELARVRQEGVRQKGQQRLQEMDMRLTAEQSRAQMHVQMENLKLDKAKAMQASNESLMRMQLSVKGHQMQMLQTLMNARSMIGEENSRRLRDQLATSTAIANIYPVLSQMRQEFAVLEQDNFNNMGLMFLEADGEDGVKLQGQYDKLAEAWRSIQGKGDFSDEMIAGEWIDKIQAVYLKMADKVMKDNGYDDLDQIDTSRQSQLVREAVKQAFNGGEHVSHGILAAASEARLGDRASQKRAEFNQKGIDRFLKASPMNKAKLDAMTPQQRENIGSQDYENYLMGFIRPGKGRNFYHFDKSSDYTDEGWLPTRVDKAFANMETSVTPGLTGLLPSYVLNQGNRIEAEKTAGLAAASIRMDMSRITNEISGLLTGVQPLDLNSIAESTESILSGDNLEYSFQQLCNLMGEDITGTLRNAQGATGVDLGLGGEGLQPPPPPPEAAPAVDTPVPDIVGQGAMTGTADNPNKVPVDRSSAELYGGQDLSGYMSNPQRQH